MVVYGYARLVAYNEKLELVPDILKDVEVEDGRIFTLHLRKGHRWSDGEPFTSEDFRYWWEDVVNNEKLSPTGPPPELFVDGELPKVEFPDPADGALQLEQAEPVLPADAGACDAVVHLHAGPLSEAVPRALRRSEAARRRWSRRPRRATGPSCTAATTICTSSRIPSCRPCSPGKWRRRRRPSGSSSNATRYFHRVDSRGAAAAVHRPGRARCRRQQAGPDQDRRRRDRPAVPRPVLQALHLPQGERGAQRPGHALVADRARRPPRALSQSERRTTRSGAGCSGMSASAGRCRSRSIATRSTRSCSSASAIGGNNTVLPQSPLYRPEFRQAGPPTTRRRPTRCSMRSGSPSARRTACACCRTAGRWSSWSRPRARRPSRADVLELVQETWLKIGVRIHSKPLQREMFRNRVFAGETLMSIWYGLENGIPSADMSPGEFAPTDQNQLQWPMWGQYYQTKGQAGEPPDLPEAAELLGLFEQWRRRAINRGTTQGLGPDPGDLQQPDLLDRSDRRGPAAGRGAQDAAQRAGRGDLQLGARRSVRDLPAGHVLVRPPRAG